MRPQADAADLQTLDVTGQKVISPAQPNSPVDWLSAAFKKLTIEVNLPGGTYDIIKKVPRRPLALETRRLRRLLLTSDHHPGQPDERQPRLHRLLRHLSSHQRPPPLSPHLGCGFRAVA